MPLTRSSIGRQSCTASRTSAQDVVERAHKRGAGFRFERIEMDLDEAFARRMGVARAQRRELVAVALDAEHRMRHQPQRQLAVGELAHRPNSNRNGMSSLRISTTESARGSARARQGHLLAADFRRAGRALGDEIPGAFGELRELGGGVVHHVFRHRAAVEPGNESPPESAGGAGRAARRPPS